MVVEFMTNYLIGAYQHLRCEFETRSGEVYSTLCDRVFQWRGMLVVSPVSSTNKTEILLKVALNTMTQKRVVLTKLDIYIFNDTYTSTT